MAEWGTEPDQEWNSECGDDAHGCLRAGAHCPELLMLCYSCNVVMHQSCAEAKGLHVEVNGEWLCCTCFAIYLANNAAS